MSTEKNTPENDRSELEKILLEAQVFFLGTIILNAVFLKAGFLDMFKAVEGCRKNTLSEETIFSKIDSIFEKQYTCFTQGVSLCQSIILLEKVEHRRGKENVLSEKKEPLLQELRNCLNTTLENIGALLDAFSEVNIERFPIFKIAVTTDPLPATSLYDKLHKSISSLPKSASSPADYSEEAAAKENLAVFYTDKITKIRTAAFGPTFKEIQDEIKHITESNTPLNEVLENRLPKIEKKVKTATESLRKTAEEQLSQNNIHTRGINEDILSKIVGQFMAAIVKFEEEEFKDMHQKLIDISLGRDPERGFPTPPSPPSK